MPTTQKSIALAGRVARHAVARVEVGAGLRERELERRLGELGHRQRDVGQRRACARRRGPRAARAPAGARRAARCDERRPSACEPRRPAPSIVARRGRPGGSSGELGARSGGARAARSGCARRAAVDGPSAARAMPSRRRRRRRRGNAMASRGLCARLNRRVRGPLHDGARSRGRRPQDRGARPASRRPTGWRADLHVCRFRPSLTPPLPQRAAPARSSLAAALDGAARAGAVGRGLELCCSWAGCHFTG